MTLAPHSQSHIDRPSTAVDNVIFSVIDNDLHVLLVKRGEVPFPKEWSIVGGFVDTHKDNDLEATAQRKLIEKTGISAPYLEQFKTIGSANRDPRCWSITTIYFSLLPFSELKPTDEHVEAAQWFKLEEAINMPLAFDHAEILKDCADRLRSKVLYTSLPVHLMPETFTLSELQKVYETIIGETIDQKSFRRRILNTDILIETDMTKQTSKRPAKLYIRNPELDTHFFTRNIEGPNRQS